LSTTGRVASANGVCVSTQSLRMLAARPRSFGLDRMTQAPASLTRRRAFSSGLSHAKCPKPGFRSNVFG
jgi:hypothetical protein